MDHSAEAPFPSPRIGVLEVVVAFGIAVASVAIVVGVIAAVLGIFEPWPVAVAAVVLGGWFTRPVVRKGKAAGSLFELRLPDVAAVVVAVLWVLLSAGHISQHVFPNTDPGVYAATGWWLAEEPTPVVDIAPGIIEESDGAFALSGFYDDRENGQLSPQFPQGLPVLLALAKTIAGTGAFFLAPLLLGAAALLALYMFGTHFFTRWWSLLATVALAVNLVHIHFSRDAYTEPLTLLLIFGSGWLLMHAFERASIAPLAGLALGAALCVRIDALVAVSVIPILFLHAALSVGVRRSALGRSLIRLTAVVIPVAIVAYIDVVTVSPSYWEAQDKRLAQVAALVVGLSLMALLTSRFRGRIVPTLKRHRTVLANTVAVLLGLGAVFVFAVRPWGPAARSTSGTIHSLACCWSAKGSLATEREPSPSPPDSGCGGISRCCWSLACSVSS